MSHTWRFPLILLLSMVFGAPVLGEMALASGDLPAAGGRYIAALALSWLGVTAIGRLMDGYAAHNEDIRLDRAAEQLGQDLQALRAPDLDLVEAGSSAEGATEPAMS